MNYLFSMAYGVNYFAMTGLLIYFSLIGKSELSADLAIVQASTTALFFAASGNVRSLVFNKTSMLSHNKVLVFRFVLILPLGAIAFYLSAYISHVAWLFVCILILRRSVEWLVEIYISDSEVNNIKENARNILILQITTLALVACCIHIGEKQFYFSLLIWAISPVVFCANYFYKNIKNTNITDLNYINLLPHLGSTAVIGIGVYVFRLVLLSLVDKSVAGDLFSAFAIGGIASSVFVQAIGPGFVGAKPSAYKSIFIRIVLSALFISGVIIVAITWGKLDKTLLLGKNGLFYCAVGYSLIGSVLMIYAQYVRLKILQHYENTNVYGHDVLINIAFVASVPFVFYIFGAKILPALFLFSAIVNLLFYFNYDFSVKWHDKNIITCISETNFKFILCFLMLLPVFIQISSCSNSWCIFNVDKMYYDTKGLLHNLPIPISAFMCMLGIVVFKRYNKSELSLTFILALFIFLFIPVVVSTEGELNLQQSKMILMMQFILPTMALALGQQIFAKNLDVKLMAKAFFYVLIFLVPVQLIVSWFDGSLVIVSHMHYFSFYQHLQYGPVIIISAYIVVLFTLYNELRYKYWILVLMPLLGIYAVASASRLTIALFITCALIFAFLALRRGAEKIILLSVIMTLLAMSLYSPYVLEKSYHYQDKIYGQQSENIAPNSRLVIWKYHLDEILNNEDVLLFGSKQRPDRATHPSAHNYYLDLIYNFGIISLIPFLWLIAYTLKYIFIFRQKIFLSMPFIGITLTALFLILIDNLFKVGFRQPYPGIFSFFIWGLLLSILMNMQNNKSRSKNEPQ